ncbi:MAG: bifunctional aspartate kinase/homoserine dehydrogenase I [Cystobacterineae bacterium]|nr:bifunctional aspartate kinase/homoserine dehydrogenase I [Cystobacterineae bacterium]
MSYWNVFRIGGPALKNHLPTVVQLIAKAPKPLAVVASPLGEVDDLLLLCAATAETGDMAKAQTHMQALRLQLQALAAPWADTLGQHLDACLLSCFEELERLLGAVSLLHRCTTEIREELLCLSARLMAEFLACVLRVEGVASMAVEPRHFFVVDIQGKNNRIHLEESRSLLQSLLPSWEGKIPVVAGATGKTPEGQSVHFGRNGADYSASALAYALEAKEVVFWTDVPGVMTADPSLVPEAYPVPHLTYEGALELAHFGSRMLHARTLIPLMACRAGLTIKSTLTPEEKGSRIDAFGNINPALPTCITSLEKLALVGVESRLSEESSRLGARALAALEKANLRVWMANESALGQNFTVAVPENQVAKACEILDDCFEEERLGGSVVRWEPRAPVTLLTLVLENMGTTPNIAGRFFSTLGNLGIDVRAISQSASERSISCAIDGPATSTAVRAVHAAFNLAHTEINLLLLGKGVVGKSLLNQMAQQSKTLREKHRISLRLVGIADSGRILLEPKGLDSATAIEQLENLPKQTHPPCLQNALIQLGHMPLPVLVDCTASAGMEALYEKAFAQGVNVVAANKQPLALPWPRRQQLLETATHFHRAYHYETTVGASLPVIETLKNLVRTGDEVQRVEGCFSGTLGFLCDCLMRGESLSKAVRTARDMGYSEPNPRDDLSGLDVARKAVILARELGMQVELSNAKVEPLVPAEFLSENNPEAFLRSLEKLDAAFSEDMKALAEKGLRLRYLAQIEPMENLIRVGPTPVSATHPAWGLVEAEALVAFYTKRYRQYPLIVRGAGAGGDVTAAGVLADVLRIAENVRGRRR